MRFLNHGGINGLFYQYEVYKSWWYERVVLPLSGLYKSWWYERVVLLLLSGKGLWADSYHTT